MAPVLGAPVEVRIGEGNRVVGFFSAWRPYDRTTLERRLPPSVQDQGGPDSSTPPPPLRYVLGEGPTQVLAPYYLRTISTEDDDGEPSAELIPASPLSLTAKIVVTAVGDRLQLVLEVAPGAGDVPLGYEWHARPLDPAVGSIETTSTGKELALPAGDYEIEAVVTTRTSGASALAAVVVESSDAEEGLADQ
jgi:hypothetical protein